LDPTREPRPRATPLDCPPRWAPPLARVSALGWHAGPDAPFPDVLERRSSERQLAILPRPKLGALLWHSARVRSTTGGEHRAAPSAGGLHPIALVVLEPPFRQAFLYDPIRHALGELAEIDTPALADACRSLLEVLPTARGTFIVALGEFRRTEAFYENSESLVWRDAGCQLATLHLTATWLGLGSCLLGVTGAGVANAICRDASVQPVGAIAVGEL
jgi:SagB-type dehydrogenase family enzyme